VDLAGSERLKKTEATGIRKMEANYINLSLTTLGIVVNALECGHPHIPFRDSKLTRLLQDSLAGNGKTRIIVTIDPHVSNVQETITSLQFGQRAMKVTTSAKVNETVDYKALCIKLQSQLDDTELKYREMEVDLEELLVDNELIEQRLYAFELKAQKDQSTKDTDSSKGTYVDNFQSHHPMHERNHKSQQDIIQQLKQQLEQEQLKHQNELQGLIRSHKEQLQERDNTIYSLESQIHSMDRDINHQITKERRLREELLVVQNRTSTLEEDAGTERNQSTSLASENQLLRLQSDNLKIENQRLLSIVEHLENNEKENERIDREYTELSLELISTRDQLNEMEMKYYSADDELQESRETVTVLTNTLQQLEKKVNEMSREISKYHRQWSEVEIAQQNASNFLIENQSSMEYNVTENNTDSESPSNSTVTVIKQLTNSLTVLKNRTTDQENYITVLKDKCLKLETDNQIQLHETRSTNEKLSELGAKYSQQSICVTSDHSMQQFANLLAMLSDNEDDLPDISELINIAEREGTYSTVRSSDRSHEHNFVTKELERSVEEIVKNTDSLIHEDNIPRRGSIRRLVRPIIDSIDLCNTQNLPTPVIPEVFGSLPQDISMIIRSMVFSDEYNVAYNRCISSDTQFNHESSDR
jgi:kinesin family protein 5